MLQARGRLVRARRSMRWSFPGSVRSAARGPSAPPFCVDCRRELLEAAGAACPRCAMPVGPWARPGRGLFPVPGEASGSTRRLRWGRTRGRSATLCLRLKHERNAWLARWLVDLLVEARDELGAAAAGRLGRAGPVALVAALAAGLQPVRRAGATAGEAAGAAPRPARCGGSWRPIPWRDRAGSSGRR